MYKIVINPNEDIWNTFVESAEDGSLLQLSQWAEVKMPTWSTEAVLIYKNEKPVAGSRLLFRKLPFPFSKYSLCYASRGPAGLAEILESNELFELLMNSIEQLAKEKGAISIILDPPILNDKRGEKLFNLFSSRGYCHKGFHRDMREIQPRCNMVLNIGSDNGVFAEINPKYLKIITKSESYPFIIKSCSETGTSDFFNVMEQTGKRDGIGVRTQKYYDNMLKAFENTDIADFKVLYLDASKAEGYIIKKSEAVEKELKDLNKKRLHLSEDKVKQTDEMIARCIEAKKRLENELNEIRQSKLDCIPLASAAVFNFNGRAYYLYGGSSNNFRKMNAVQILIADMIQTSAKRSCKIFDFGGVSGETDISKDPDYGGLYTAKSLWGAKMEEYIGEFEKPLRPLLFKTMNSIIKMRKKIRKPSRNRKNK